MQGSCADRIIVHIRQVIFGLPKGSFRITLLRQDPDGFNGFIPGGISLYGLIHKFLKGSRIGYGGEYLQGVAKQRKTVDAAHIPAYCLLYGFALTVVSQRLERCSLHVPVVALKRIQENLFGAFRSAGDLCQRGEKGCPYLRLWISGKQVLYGQLQVRIVPDSAQPLRGFNLLRSAGVLAQRMQQERSWLVLLQHQLLPLLFQYLYIVDQWRHIHNDRIPASGKSNLKGIGYIAVPVDHRQCNQIFKPSL